MYGYTSFQELLKAVFKNLNNEWIIKILIPLITSIDLIFRFFFQSENAIYFLIILYLVDFITGIVKSLNYTLKIKRMKKQGLEISNDLYEKRLVSKKFPRFLLTLLCSLLLLSLLKFAGIHSIVFLPLYSIFYSVFVGQNLISIVENMVELEIVPPKLLDVLKSKIKFFKK